MGCHEGSDAPASRNPLQIHGTVQASVDNDGTLIILKIAVYLDPDAATDLCCG